MVIPTVFGVEFKQIMYIVGFIFITVVAISALTLLYYVRKKIKDNTLITGMSGQEIPELSKEDNLKLQLKDLEKQRKDIESGLKGSKQKVVSVKHSTAKTISKAKLVEPETKPEIIEDSDTEIKPFDAVRTGKSKLSIKYWKAHLLERFNPETTALISMELMNGFHRLFVVKEKDEGFQYRGKKYLFDNEAKYYIIDSKLWCYDFHENFTLPIKRKIPLTHIKKSLEHSNISEVEYATNPATLERFTISKIAEGIMKGQAIDEFMKQIRLLLIIAMVTAVIHLALFMFKSGMLQSIKIPGVTS